MTGYNYTELLIKAAAYDHPEEIPIAVGMLPAVFIKHGDAVRSLIEKYPGLHFEMDKSYDPAADMPESYRKGQSTDAWGCVWSVKAFYLPEGGFGINLEIGPDVPLESIDVLLNALDKARTYR